MALFGSGKNQRPSAQYEQKRSNSRQQQRYQNEREFREQRVKSRNRLIGSVILVLAAIIILPLILKTGDDGSSSDRQTEAPLIAPGSSIGQSGLVVESSPGIQTPDESELTADPLEASEEGIAIAEGAMSSEAGEELPLAVAGALPEGEDEIAQVESSGVSIAESTAEQNDVQEAAARERAEQEAAAQERARQEQAKLAQAEKQKREQQQKEQQKQQQPKQPTTQSQRTDDGSKALAILEGRATQSTPSSNQSTAPAASTGEFSLQVASYSSANDARTQRDRLRGAGVSNAYVQSATVSGNQVFRLRVGPFSSREAAQAAQTRLRALNFSDSFITGR